MMDFNLTVEQQQIREEIKKVCKEFPDAYWREVDREKAYPEAFVRKLSELGWLAALIPEEFGGTGLGITEASIILEEINHSGGVATACHAQMYTMGTLLRHGNEEQKKRHLPNCHRRVAPAGVRCHRAQCRLGEHQNPNHCHAPGRQVSDQRPKDLHLARVAVRLDAFARAHDQL
jgi:hypothetical protein